jgi:hypothetical protein
MDVSLVFAGPRVAPTATTMTRNGLAGMSSRHSTWRSQAVSNRGAGYPPCAPRCRATEADDGPNTFFTQLPNVPALMPGSRATSTIGLPVSRTIVTAPSRNSASYFLRIAGMASPHGPCLHGTGGRPADMRVGLRFGRCAARRGCQTSAGRAPTPPPPLSARGFSGCWLRQFRIARAICCRLAAPHRSPVEHAATRRQGSRAAAGSRSLVDAGSGITHRRAYRVWVTATHPRPAADRHTRATGRHPGTPRIDERRKP